MEPILTGVARQDGPESRPTDRMQLDEDDIGRAVRPGSVQSAGVLGWIRLNLRGCLQGHLLKQKRDEEVVNLETKMAKAETCDDFGGFGGFVSPFLDELKVLSADVISELRCR